jgi:hypothetical protein
LLQPPGTKDVFAYVEISNSANLAIARWPRRDEWLDTINCRSSPGASSRSILNDSLLKIAEMAEMALVGVHGVGKIQPRQRIAVIAQSTFFVVRLPKMLGQVKTLT